MSALRFLQPDQGHVMPHDIIHGTDGHAPHRKGVSGTRRGDPSRGRLYDLDEAGQAPEADGPVSARGGGASDLLVVPALGPDQPVELRAPEDAQAGEAAFDGPAVERDPRGNIIWTDDLKAAVKALWLMPEVGTVEIAARLGLPSKNVVIGIARRMELGDKPPPPKRTEEEVEAAKEAQRAANRARHKANRDRIAALPPEERPQTKPRAYKPKPPKEKVEAEPSRVSIPGVVQKGYEPKPEIIAVGTKSTLELGKADCKWPIGDPGTEGFSHCGRKKTLDPDMPYCVEHARVAYQPVPPKSGTTPLKQFLGGRRR